MRFKISVLTRENLELWLTYISGFHGGLAVTLDDVLQRLREERLDLSTGHLEQLSVAVHHFARANGDAVSVDLAAIRTMMRSLQTAGRSPRTVNNHARSIMYLCDQGGIDIDRRKLSLLREPQRYPTAWTAEQLRSLVQACRTAPVQRGWGPDHWEALILTVYDTSLRVGCLMKIPATALLAGECRLLVPGEFQKGGTDTYQTLHPDTSEKLQRLSRADSDRLFPWPYAREELWRRLESLILAPAGLPHGRRDKFHRLRRTSYTMVAKAFGVEAASRHAAHKQDLSRFYLDRTMIDHNPLDALPRPQ